MTKEQLDAVRDQLLAEKDDDLRQTFLSAFIEDNEKGASMLIDYAAKKGLKVDESPKEVIEYIGTIDGEDIDIEMTPEILALASGGSLRDKREKHVQGYGYDEKECGISQHLVNHGRRIDSHPVASAAPIS